MLCDRYGIALIADEVMSGFGRTGKWFAVDNWRVIPDIMTMAKVSPRLCAPRCCGHEAGDRSTLRRYSFPLGAHLHLPSGLPGCRHRNINVLRQDRLVETRCRNGTNPEAHAE